MGSSIKAKNIRKRVFQHFYEKKNNKYKLGQETFYIDFEITNNELLALLLESEKIRKFYPKYNRAQKRPTSAFQIIQYVNQRGIVQLAVQKTKLTRNSVGTFYRYSEAKEALESLCEQFRLCPRFCTLQPQASQCSHYKLKSCEGICENNEPVDAYNKKVIRALDSLKNDLNSFVIHGKGRNRNEIGFVLVLNGTYQGIGYFEKETAICHLSDYETFLIPQRATYHTDIIIRSYLRKTGTRNIIYFNDNFSALPMENSA